MCFVGRGPFSSSGAGALAVLVALGGAPALAESVRFYDLEGFGHFLDGNPETTAITEDGAIALPPPTVERFADAAAVFSAATGDGDEVLVARADDGQVLAIDRAGKTRNLYKAEETMVTSLLATDQGLFVGTGAPGKVYRVGRDGKAELYYSADAAYVWSLVRGPDGALYAATGDPGTVVRIDKKQSGKVVFAPERTHLRALVADPKLGLFVGGGDRGIVYRAAAGTDFRALYDTGHPEVTAIVTQGDSVYAAGVTGAQELAELDTGKPEKGKGGSVRSQLVRIGMDGSTETLAGSNDEVVFALAVDAKGQVLVATGATGREDPRGRVYAVDPGKRLIAMIYQSPSRRLTHLVPIGKAGLAAVAAAGGRVTVVSNGYARTGQFLTLPFDAGINSRFGILQVFGDWPKGTKVTAAVRVGQTSEPDASWSDWSSEIAAPGNVRPKVSNGRYAQVRLTLAGDGRVMPTVYRVRLAYLRQNLAPFVREVTALSKGLALYPLPQDAPKSKTVSLGDKGTDERRRGNDDEEEGPSPGRARQVEEPGALTLRWVAEDPNGDALRYDLKYRNAGRGEWRSLKGELEEPFYTLRSTQLPDGHYQFRVEASDAPSNPPGEERTDSRDSRDVLVDNTPPRVDPLRVQVQGRAVTVRGVFADAVGPLMQASYSLDAREPKPLRPDDGVLDGPGETFTLTFGELGAGMHTLTVRVRDEAQNEGVAEAVFTLP